MAKKKTIRKQLEDRIKALESLVKVRAESLKRKGETIKALDAEINILNVWVMLLVEKCIELSGGEEQRFSLAEVTKRLSENECKFSFSKDVETGEYVIRSEKPANRDECGDENGEQAAQSEEAPCVSGESDLKNNR